MLIFRGVYSSLVQQTETVDSKPKPENRRLDTVGFEKSIANIKEKSNKHR